MYCKNHPFDVSSPFANHQVSLSLLHVAHPSPNVVFGDPAEIILGILPVGLWFAHVGSRPKTDGQRLFFVANASSTWARANKRSMVKKSSSNVYLLRRFWKWTSNKKWRFWMKSTLRSHPGISTWSTGKCHPSMRNSPWGSPRFQSGKMLSIIDAEGLFRRKGLRKKEGI